MKKLMILVLALAVFAGAFVLRAREGGSGTVPDGGSPTAVALATPSSESGVASTAVSGSPEHPERLPRLVDLGSDRCVPCKQMAPILEALSREYEGALRVEFIDVWKDAAAGQQWGVRVIPTQIFLDASGTERFRHEGFYGREDILAKWKELGVELTPTAARS